MDTDYEMIKFLGEGAFGKVFLIKDKLDSGTERAMKILDMYRMDEYTKEKTLQEVQLLSELNHPNILTLIRHFVDDDAMCIITEFCPNGDLDDYIEARRGNSLEEPRLVEWFRQITSAVEFLHKKKIIHRDLKTQNIFLDVDMNCKLGDFGIAKVLESQYDMATTQIGTPQYMSPEIFMGIGYNEKTDIWSLAVVIYELAMLEKPFNAMFMPSLVFMVTRGEKPRMPQDYSDDFQDILSNMMEKQPTDRPSASEILQHQLFRGTAKPDPMPSLSLDHGTSNIEQNRGRFNLSCFMTTINTTKMDDTLVGGALAGNIETVRDKPPDELEDIVTRTLRNMGISSAGQDFGHGKSGQLKQREHELKLYCLSCMDNDESLFDKASEKLDAEDDLEEIEETLIELLGDKYALCGVQLLMYKNFSFNLRQFHS